MSLRSLPLPVRSRNSRKEIKQPARKLFSCNAVHSLRARCFRFVHRQRLQLTHYLRASAPADSDARAVAVDHDFPTGCPTRGKLFSCSSFSKKWAFSRSVSCLRTRLVLDKFNPSRCFGCAYGFRAFLGMLQRCSKNLKVGPGRGSKPLDRCTGF